MPRPARWSRASPVPFVDLSAQHAALAGPFREAIEGVLARGDFILGEDVERFEAEFAAYCEAPFAVGVDSGTSALELALRAFGCGAGDEVITVPNTFIATALAISMTGATPVFVDADPATATLDPERLEAAITPRTKAVLPVHLFGQVAEMDPIEEIARAHGLRVLEDACQAHGARYRGRRAGSLGDAAAFSFYPAKNLGALGDGGIVVTRDEEVAERVRLLRNYGQREKNRHDEVGYNRRLDTLHAAFLRAKLPQLDSWNEARRERAQLYNELLVDAVVELPQVAAEREHVWHLFVVRTSERDALRAALGERGIGTGLHYPDPIHLQPAYRELRLPRGSFPVAERLASEGISLPMYPELPHEWVQEVADAVMAFGAGTPLAASGSGQAPPAP